MQRSILRPCINILVYETERAVLSNMLQNLSLKDIVMYGNYLLEYTKLLFFN